jgi:hypothetical protein
MTPAERLALAISHLTDSLSVLQSACTECLELRTPQMADAASLLERATNKLIAQHKLVTKGHL